MTDPTAGHGATEMDPERYLERIGVDPRTVEIDRETLERLQRAHVTSVPFETLSITGHPEDGGDGPGVSPAIPASYEKIVDRERGGFCYELNGPFGWLLSALGFDVDTAAARVVEDEDGVELPANHRTNLVHLGETYVADVGMGVPTMRRPLPVEGRPVEDGVGVAWRVVESDRPDADYRTQYRTPRDDGWQDRYQFDTTPRNTSFFAATCEYLQTAPESGFTGDPVVSIATESGHEKLKPDRFVRYEGGTRAERKVTPAEFDELLGSAFGLTD
jgi:N-hydroxyarylamine O-acetyltransferase